MRTPRGRGKPDGALHAVPTVRLAATALKAAKASAQRLKSAPTVADFYQTRLMLGKYFMD